MNLPRIEQADVKSKRILLRVDLEQVQTLDKKIEETSLFRFLPTLELLAKRGGRVLLLSHLKNPKQSSDALSLKPYSELISKAIGKKIGFISSKSLEDWKRASFQIEDGEIALLENLASFPGEEECDSEFAKKLAELGDIFVNEAFSISNKKLASTTKLPELLESYAGSLFYREVETFDNLLSRPAKPFIAIIGGARVSSKWKVLNTLLTRVNSFLIGGGVAYTFLKARAVPIGDSIVEKNYEVLAHQFIDKAGVEGVEIQFPIDHIIANSFSEKAKIKTVDKMGILDGWFGMDIGSKTISNFERAIKNAGTIFWLGPMGVIEFEKFASGSLKLAKILSKSSAKTIVGGLDTTSVVYNANLQDKFTHISTGNGSFIELLEGKLPPAIQALMKTKEIQ